MLIEHAKIYGTDLQFAWIDDAPNKVRISLTEFVKVSIIFAASRFVSF